MGMRVNSGGAASWVPPVAWQQRQQNLQALSKALQSNDLAAAKTAFTSLTGGAQSTSGSNPNSPLSQLGQALQSGDLGAAQKAFAQMRGSHHSAGSAGSALIGQTQVSPATATAGNTVNVYV